MHDASCKRDMQAMQAICCLSLVIEIRRRMHAYGKNGGCLQDACYGAVFLASEMAGNGGEIGNAISGGR